MTLKIPRRDQDVPTYQGASWQTMNTGQRVFSIDNCEAEPTLTFGDFECDAPVPQGGDRYDFTLTANQMNDVYDNKYTTDSGGNQYIEADFDEGNHLYAGLDNTWAT